MAKNTDKTPIKSHITRRMSNFVEKSPLRKSIPHTSTPILQHVSTEKQLNKFISIFFCSFRQ